MGQCYPTARQVVGPVETTSKTEYGSHELERRISRLVEDVEVSINVPRYATRHASIVATGKKGRAPGELKYPHCVVVHEDTHQIFVASKDNDRVEIFSETAEFIGQLGVGQLFGPWGIAIHGESLYVSCHDHTVSKFSLTEMCRVRRIGGYGSNNGQFACPDQLTTDPIGHVFIADSNNDRICIHYPNLDHLHNITHLSMSLPSDVKILRDHLYVSCRSTSLCILVLTLEGDKLHLFDAKICGTIGGSFCLDPLNNFVLCKFWFRSIGVFSLEGNLLYTIGRYGHRPGLFDNPHGVAITPNGRLVCVSCSESYGLQIIN